MKDMLPAQNRMPRNPPQEILQHPHPSCNNRRILFRLALTLYGVVCEGLFRWDWRDDEDGVEGDEGGAEGVECRVAATAFVVLSEMSAAAGTSSGRTHSCLDHINNIARLSTFCRLYRIHDLSQEQ
jgi:hypothetical protein